jgi:hypothetical protein
MSLRNERQTENREVEELLVGCYAYWLNHHVELSQVEMMVIELEQHLQSALHDGKTIAEVVGPDPEAFAREWARETQTPLSAGTRIINALYPCFIAFAIILLPQHVARRTLHFPLSWDLLVLSVLVLGFICFAKSGKGSFVTVPKNGKKRYYGLLIMIAYMGGILAFSRITSMLHADRWLVLGIWQWWMSLVLLGATVLAYILVRSMNPKKPGGFFAITKISEITHSKDDL